ncbi:hypothetical protein T484DRAFT_1965419 [Baffinella frigidus]|nr:hypothetical protein T484DRAFT_1965419 [Cryptophyta sp. CCMP2293]
MQTRSPAAELGPLRRPRSPFHLPHCQLAPRFLPAVPLHATAVAPTRRPGDGWGRRRCDREKAGP